MKMSIFKAKAPYYAILVLLILYPIHIVFFFSLFINGYAIGYENRIVIEKYVYPSFYLSLCLSFLIILFISLVTIADSLMPKSENGLKNQQKIEIENEIKIENKNENKIEK